AAVVIGQSGWRSANKPLVSAEFSERSLDALGMPPDPHVAHFGRNGAVRRYHKSAPDDSPVLPSEHALLLPYPMQRGHGMFGVGQQCERQGEALTELCMRLHGV